MLTYATQWTPRVLARPRSGGTGGVSVVSGAVRVQEVITRTRTTARDLCITLGSHTMRTYHLKARGSAASRRSS